ADHAGWVHDASGWNSLGGSIPGPSIPGQISGVTWGNGNHAVYAIGADDTVSLNDGSGWTSLGGFVARQISAGVDAAGNPLVYAIGKDDAVYVNNGSGWSDLGFTVRQIAGCHNNTVLAIGTDDTVWVNHQDGNGWTSLGGTAVRQLTLGLDAAGKPEAF